jgi:hypothetical protein
MPNWMGFAYTEVFKQFAARDAEAAWEALPADDRQREAMRGFLAGMRTAEQLQEFVDRWSVLWNSEGVAKAHAERVEYEERQTVRDPVTGGVSVTVSLWEYYLYPPEELISLDVAQSLARFDFASAERWLQENGPGDAAARDQRRHYVLSGSAIFPQFATEDFRVAGEYQATIARSVIVRDPSRAVEVMESIADERSRYSILSLASSPLGWEDPANLLPTPGDRNQLPDFAARYEQILAGVEAGRFSQSVETDVRYMVNRGFQHTVPAAKIALGETVP